MTRAIALQQFLRDRSFWMRRARECRAAGNLAAAQWCVEGARIANRNLTHVMRRVPA